MELRDDYTSIVVSYSTGIDSTGALYKALELAKRLNKPKLVLLYCDTGMEYAINDSLFYRTAAVFEMTPVLLKHELDFMGILTARQMWPDTKNRWCTSYLKTDITNKWIRHNRPWLGEHVLFVTGERREESRRRAGYAELSAHPTTLKTERKGVFTCDWWRPVLDCTKPEMFTAGRVLGLAPHPCYEYVDRCSCMLCIYKSVEHAKANMRRHPAECKRWVDAEVMIGHTWRQDISLKDLWDQVCEEAEPEIIV